MKIYKIIILCLFIQLPFIGTVHAKCDLESYKFGVSYKSLMNKLKVDEELIEPEIKGVSEQLVFFPGDLVCKNEKSFEGAPINFIFLYGELVEIQIIRLSQEPALVYWAESIYGEKEDKPSSFYNVQPNAQWFWDNSNSTISYSIESDEYEMIESIIIQSSNHQKYFEKLAIEQEGE